MAVVIAVGCLASPATAAVTTITITSRTPFA